MKTTLSLSVVGLPRPAGSKRAFAIRKNGQLTGRVSVVDACTESREWKTAVAREAVIAMNSGRQIFTGPVRLRLLFQMPRLKGHFGTGKNANVLKAHAPARPTVKPDLLKLARAVEDALTGIVWRDDAQVVIEQLEKVYGGCPGCSIEVEEV